MRHRGSLGGLHALRPSAWGWAVVLVVVGAGQPAVAARSGQATAQQPATPQALTPVAFTALLQQLQRQSFGDEQLAVVRAAVHRGRYFTCAQAGQLMRTAVLGGDQVKIAAALYPRLIDPENFTQLVSTLTLESDRQYLRNLVSR